MNEHVHKKLCAKSQPLKDAEVICNHSVNGYYRNSATSHWMSQNFAATQSLDVAKNSATTQSLVARILRSLRTMLSQKFCDRWVIGCRRDWVIAEFLGNSAIIQPQVVAEILETLIKWWIQQFSNLAKTSQ